MGLNENGELVWDLLLSESPHNGAGVWSSFALDPETEVLFFKTSNNYTGEANEFSDAFVAVDAKTGEMQWKTQVTQHDVWVKAKQEGPDYAFGASPPRRLTATLGASHSAALSAEAGTAKQPDRTSLVAFARGNYPQSPVPIVGRTGRIDSGVDRCSLSIRH